VRLGLDPGGPEGSPPASPRFDTFAMAVRTGGLNRLMRFFIREVAAFWARGRG
jgi:hypothetical protein